MNDPSEKPASPRLLLSTAVVILFFLAGLLLIASRSPWAIWTSLPILLLAGFAIGGSLAIRAIQSSNPTARLALPKWSRLEWWILAILYASPVALFLLLGRSAALSAGITALAAFVATQVIVIRHGGWQLVGPHVYYDVVRLARRGRSTVLRIVCLLAMLAGLFIVYEQLGWRERMRPNDLADVSVRFAYALFVVQNLAILMLAPPYIASTVTEERERGTLELLFTTHLNNREIVLGILSARVVHLFGFVIAGFPILALIQFWGGIDFLVLVGNLANTLLNALTIGSICLLISTLARGTTSAVMIAYAIVLPIGFCCTGTLRGFPLVLQDSRLAGAGQVISVQDIGILAVLHLAISGFCLWLAIMAVREHEPFAPPLAPPPAKPKETQTAVSEPAPAVTPGEEHRRGLPNHTLDAFGLPYELPPITGNALWWKERYVGGPPLLYSPVFAIVLIPFFVTVPLLTIALIIQMIVDRTPVLEPSPRTVLSSAIGFFYWLFLGLFVLNSTYRAAASIARERQQQTLEPLLLLPIERGEILFVKFVGCIYRGWPWLALLSLDLVPGLLSGAFHPFSFVCLVVGPMPMIACFVFAGMYLSVVMRTVMRAFLTIVLVMVAYVGLSLMAGAPLLAFSYLDAFMWPIWGLRELQPGKIWTALSMFGGYTGLAGLFCWRMIARFNDRSLQ